MRGKLLTGLGIMLLAALTQSQPDASAATTATTATTATSGVTNASTAASTSNAAATADPKVIEEQLRDMGDTLKKTYNAANSLQSECSRAYNADAIDNVIMDPWMAGQPGLANVIPPPFPGALKPLPPRKKWVDQDMTQLTQVLKILTTEINAVGAASSLDTSIKVSIEIMQDNLEQVDEQYARLNSLANPSTSDEKGLPNYDKIGMARAAQNLKDETSGINEIRKRLIRQIRELDKK